MTFLFKYCILNESRGGAEIGRQARLRILCPVGRVGSSPILRSKYRSEFLIIRGSDFFVADIEIFADIENIEKSLPISKNLC